MTWRVNMYSELTKPPWSKSEWGMKISLRGRYLQKSLAYKSQHSTRTHISSLIIMLGKGKTNERTDPIINSAYLMISNPTPRSSRFTLKNPIHSGYRTYTRKRWSDRRRICISWKQICGYLWPEVDWRAVEGLTKRISILAFNLMVSVHRSLVWIRNRNWLATSSPILMKLNN